jgi:hypothetical protein
MPANDSAWMHWLDRSGLGRGEAGCRSAAVRATPLTRRVERGQEPERLDQTKNTDQTEKNVLNVTQLLSCYALQRLPPSFREKTTFHAETPARSFFQ